MGERMSAGQTELEIRRNGVGGKLVFRRRYRLGEGETRDAQQKEEFTGPKQNIQQASALKIAQVLRLQTHVEGFSRAFLDEGPHGGQVDRFRGELAATRIDALQSFVTTRQEMVQAESLAIQ
jgi:hypothetical protein